MPGRMETKCVHGEENSISSGNELEADVGKDNYQEDGINEEEIQKLEQIEGEDMSCLRTATLEHVGKWKKWGRG